MFTMGTFLPPPMKLYTQYRVVNFQVSELRFNLVLHTSDIVTFFEEIFFLISSDLNVKSH